MPRRQDFGASSGNIGRRSIGRCIRRGRGTKPGNVHRRAFGRRFTDLQRHRRIRNLPMTIYLALGLAAAVAGLIIGRTAVGVAGRSAANPDQAARRRYAVLIAVMVLGATLLLIDAIDTPRHRYVNLAVVAIMIGGVAFDWFRSRRRRTRLEPPQQTEDE